MVAWKDTSMAATKRREEIREQELAEARSGAGEEKMLKKMSKRAQEEAEEKARILEARRAAQAQTTSTTVEEDTPAALAEEKKEEAPKEEAAPVKISFGLKAKAAPVGKTGFGQMKSQSIFKRQRLENGDEAPKKKVKL
jgi:DNA/RNA-binding protein KIN17